MFHGLKSSAEFERLIAERGCAILELSTGQGLVVKH